MNKHLTSEEIQILVTGQIPALDLDQWMDHLENCERCVDRVDEAWPLLKESSDTSVPTLDAAHVTAMRSQIFRRIHAFEVGRQSLRLALFAPLAFLQGLFGGKRR